ncbi:hypothetical protein CEE69_15065 [Rhodopirellula bahusiensis]|uniref:Uncharacterized protein n=1 Tax=Rhodopirellula bahusiensis TaxID=2014065 RepID=A0A2G1W646_9BACT|nr:hypothetical protein CEE69_15065 [Rhodopirellula bahusiensis]
MFRRAALNGQASSRPGATSHTRPSPSRTPERRRSTSPQTLFREMYVMLKSAEKRYQQTARPSFSLKQRAKPRRLVMV